MISRCNFMHLLFHLRNNLITILLHSSHTPYLLRNIYIYPYIHIGIYLDAKVQHYLLLCKLYCCFFSFFFFYEEKRAKSEEKKRKEKFIFHP